jgi:sigma-54 dependent transcriptional regulator, acetoin dehydrogenase operon transcriptional activator AcoR
MVCAAARQIEHRLFMASFVGRDVLRLHPLLDNGGTPNDGLLALSEDGIVIGADQVARSLLSLTDTEIGQVSAEEVIGEALPLASGQLSYPITPLRSTHLGTLYGHLHHAAEQVRQTPLLSITDSVRMQI